MCVDLDWSLYVWNFERRTVVVIDPVTMENGVEAVTNKHNGIVQKMHKGISLCKDQLFQHPQVDMIDWEIEYLTVEGAHGVR